MEKFSNGLATWGCICLTYLCMFPFLESFLPFFSVMRFFLCHLCPYDLFIPIISLFCIIYQLLDSFLCSLMCKVPSSRWSFPLSTSLVCFLISSAILSSNLGAWLILFCPSLVPWLWGSWDFEKSICCLIFSCSYCLFVICWGFWILVVQHFVTRKKIF